MVAKTVSWWLAVAFLCLPAGACMTLDTQTNKGYDGPRTYSGSRADLVWMRENFFHGNLPVMLVFGLDLPLSFVADSLLLPLTLQQHRARSAEQAEHLRADVEMPSPLSAGNDLSVEGAARSLFRICAQRFEMFSPGVVDCYSIHAKIITESGEILEGGAYKPILVQSLGRLKKSGGFLAFHDEHYKVETHGVRVRALQASSVSSRPFPVTFVLRAGPDGGWRIMEQEGLRLP